MVLISLLHVLVFFLLYLSFFTTDAVAILRWSKECDRVRVATDKIYATKMNYDAPVSAARLFNE